MNMRSTAQELVENVDTVTMKDADVKFEQFFGFLNFKFKEFNATFSVHLDDLPIFR